MSQDKKTTNRSKSVNKNTGKHSSGNAGHTASGSTKSTSKTASKSVSGGTGRRAARNAAANSAQSAPKAEDKKKSTAKAKAADAPAASAPKAEGKKKSGGFNKVPIIVSLIVVLLGAAGFAYANVVLNAPKEIITEDGALYCLDGRGEKKVSCWIDFQDNRYYAGEDGKLYADKLEKIEEKSYCFAEDGTLFSGIFSFHDDIYSSEPDGSLIEAQGWEDHDGNTYYNSGTGRCVSADMMDLDGETYYLDPSGILQRDTIFKFNDNKFFADPDGKVLKNQIIEHGGNNYYAGPDGAFIRNTFTPFEDHYLFINEDSAIVKEPFTLENGYEITPDPVTGAIPEKEYKISQSEYIYNGKATYIKADIASQSMIFVKDGELLISAPIVSGKRGKFDTPRGTFQVQYKARNTQLKGEVTVKGEYDEVPLTEAERAKLIEANGGSEEGVPTTKQVPKKEEWDVNVNYWISFYGTSYGFHDATWRGYFGGYIYTYDGSHGCVNLPLWAAEKLYNNVEDGTPVYII
ncbi:MAG: L,D-transpeptidase family protein [Clostridia bacterium]|nr:L,D-transpeptidase family protein [Clostridia bacterium]